MNQKLSRRISRRFKVTGTQEVLTIIEAEEAFLKVVGPCGELLLTIIA